MISRLWTAFLLSLACASTIAWLVALMHEKNVRPVQDLVAFFKKQSKVGRVLLGTFFIAMWVIASTKPGNGGGNGGGEGGGGDGGTNNIQMVIGPGGGLQPLDSTGAVTNDQQQGFQGGIQPPQGGMVGDPAPATDEWTDFTPITSTNTTRTLDGDDFRRGFVMYRIGTDEEFDFSAPPGATVCTDWRSFGAASDWIYVAFTNWAFRLGTNEVDRLRVFSFGKIDPLVRDAEISPERSEPCEARSLEGCVIATNNWFAPFVASLGIVPQTNWPLVAGNGNAAPEDISPSQFWHFISTSNTLQLTWQNVLLDRLTNTPVSVQMEVWPSGRFTYRYDLSRLDVEEVTNALVGACFSGLEWATNSIPTNLTSLAFYPLLPEDAANEDRDGDGLSLLDELFAFGTDPELWDTDHDGLSDGEEVAAGMNPRVRDADSDGFADGTDVRPFEVDAWTDGDADGFPDIWKNGWFGTDATVAADADANADGISNLAALLMGVNPLVPCTDGFSFVHGIGADGIKAWEIVPVSFEFAGRESLTNLVSRTFTINRESPWEQFFVSSRPDCAEGWSMADSVLLYGLDGEPATNALPSAVGDSWRVPLGEAMPQSISFRLDVDGETPFLSAPLYLLRWTPRIEFLPSENVTVIAGTNGHVYAAAKRNPETGAYGIPFRADVAGIPCREGAGADVVADLASPPVDGVAVSNGMFTAVDPLMADLPPEGTNLSKRLLFYSIDFDRTGAVSSGPRASSYASPYPLTSSSLRKAFHAATGVTADGSVTLTLSPDVPELGFTTGGSALRGGLRLLGATSGGSKSDTVMPPASVTPTVCGDSCTNDTHEVECEYPENHDGTSDEDDNDDDDDDDCECCDDGGSSLGSFRIRIPFGESAKDEHLGYLWTVMDGPTAVTPSAFGVLAAQGVSVVTNANGTLSISCSAAGGKSLTVTNMAHGAAVSVWNSSGRFESRWEVFNEFGDTSRIRVRRITVLGNATVDETYATWTEDEPTVFEEMRSPATAWEKSDNIRGVTKTRYEWRDGNDHDFISEEYDETRFGGNLARAEQRTYEKVGEGSTARRRLSRTYGYDERGWYETVRTYWCDTDHPDRHARLKSIRSDLHPWAWHDYDASGREIVRIEQMDGTPFPELSAVSPDANLPQGCAARITVTDYETQDGDDAHRNDSFEPREVSVYVRHGASEPILVSHETRLYTREMDASGNPLRRIVKNIGLDGAVRTETTVEYPQDSAVPSHLRGLSVLVSNADGSVTSTSYSLSNSCLVATSHTTFNGIERQTYDVMVTDAAYRLQLRGETRLSSNGGILEWSERTYDDIRRLRSVSYSDGTSETNAYSCCRLLWRRDRQGRKVLRSAQTGTDSLYYADEDVWLADVSTDGTHRIVQHHFDGFGRQTETLTHLGSTPGEATSAYSPTAGQQPSERSVEYYDGDTNGSSESTDERGKVTWGSSWRQVSSEQTGESVYGDDGWSDYVSTYTTRYRNGGTAVESWWDNRWRRENTSIDYDSAGRRVESIFVVASDHALVTNSVTATDALGRMAYAWTPSGATEFVYDGTSSRMLRMEFSAGQVERTSYMIHNQAGEQVGTVLDGVTNRTDVTYEEISNSWWRVTTEVIVGPNTNSVSILKEQMTGLGGGLRGRKASIDATGLETFTELTFNADTQIETESEVRSDGTWKTTRRKHGLVIETETAAGRTVNTYDGFGRVISVERTQGADVNLQPVSRTEYTPWGDVTAVETYTNGTDVVRESYGYDEFGNRTAVTNALGEVVESDFDVFGNIVAMRGATYPVEMDYDTENRRTALRTTRDGVTWDTTTWTYDHATGNCLSKTYADGSTVLYTYTPDNLLLRTTYASGKWKENVYDSQRRLCGVVYSSPDMDYELQLDEYGRTLFASNGVAQTCYALNVPGGATNETRATDNAIDTITRTFDGADRLTGLAITGQGYAQYLAYSTNGILVSISNLDAVVTYAYSSDLKDVGYTMAFAGGGTFVRSVARDPYRRENITGITNAIGGILHALAYGYDALARPVTRNGDAFAYNPRGEVESAMIDGNSETHRYDFIGNSLFSTFNGATNTYTANNLNQYVSIFRASSSPREISHDADGNMTNDGVFTYTYDSASRLTSVSSNGLILVTNQYDHKGRRVRKTTPTSETTFLYDVWNLIYEREIVGTITNETFYYWGKDISGTLQGAVGIGGLLYLKRNGTIYVPHYDAYGNVVRYTDTAGNIVAAYVYGAFGNILSASGSLANKFRPLFSTKYLDIETGLYYYGFRFYSPPLMRWLNRDPIGEVDCPNLYCSFVNSPVFITDPLGKTVFVIADSTPSRRASITVQRGNRTLSPRGITRITGALNFSCDKKCVLHAKGVIQLWIELLNEDSPRWSERYPRYSSSTNTREDQNTLSHEMDHFSTWSAFLDFVKTANSLDGKRFSDCQDRASRYNAAYRKYRAETSAHSLKFDQPGWNQGNQYSRHPLNTSMFKWE